MKKLLILAGCFLMVFGMVSFANALPFSDVITGSWSFNSGTQTWTFDLDTDVLVVGDIGPEDTILPTSDPTTLALEITFTDTDRDCFLPSSKEYADIYIDGVLVADNLEIDSGTLTFTADIYATIVGDHQLVVSIVGTGGTFGVTGLELLGSYTDNSPAAVPEPTTLILLGSGLFGLVGLRRKFKN